VLSILLAVLAIALLATTLIARSPLTWWWIRACEFPRLQLAALAALTALLVPLAAPPWSTVALAASLATLGLQTARILPWTPLWPVQVQRAEPGQEPRCVTLLVANVLTSNRNAETLIRLAHEHRPDLVLTLESDAWWQARLDGALGDDWPHAVRVPMDNLYGMHLYSRRALVDPEVRWLIQEDIPSIHTGITLPSGDVVRLHALHPRPPAPNESEESLWRDAELLLVGKAIHEDPVPTHGGRRPQRRGLVTHHPALLPGQWHARSAPRARHVQHLPRRLSAAALAPGPRLQQRALHPGRPAAPAAHRLRPLPDAGHPLLPTFPRRRARDARGRPPSATPARPFRGRERDQEA
jgi:endonuclease/exonuclease/phosphatase (EEP) superfamily protein YafD